MAMLLVPLIEYKHCSESLTLVADEKLVIKKGFSGALVDELDAKVPNGKVWEVEMNIKITERTA